MAINFCLPCYNPSISCSNVCADGYEVSNLISGDCHALKRGFRAEYFIKPPVDIIISFSVPVEISHVILGLKIGEQQTSGFEIWAQYIKKDLHEVEENKDFQIVARKYDVKVPAICVRNQRYKPRGLTQCPLHLQPRDVPIEYFQMNNFQGILSSVGRLKVRLTRTLGSSVPVLSCFQVWGQPSRNCKLPFSLFSCTSRSMAKMAFLEASSKDKEDKRESCSSTSREDATTLDQGDDVEVDVDIPSEFIDPITCELMTLPFILPSGHTIDQITLEKCNKSQIVWGHLPNDPFTGLPYNSDHQPVFNSALKSRIDKYLLGDGHLLKVPRTVGKNKASSQRLQLNTGLLKIEKQMQSFTDSGSKPNSCTKNDLHSSSCELDFPKNIEKRTVPFVEKPVTNTPLCEIKRLKYDSENPTDSSLSETETICNKADITLQEKSHEEQLTLSLNTAINSTLKSLKSFSKPSVPLIQTVPKCVNSGCHDSDIIYCLPCSHILCRDCLLKCNSCSVCNRGFLSNDVIRVYK